ncbi:MAG: hypothetical protein AAGF98_16570 [Cyanobacteria bacterium P01_H01_bin.153]
MEALLQKLAVNQAIAESGEDPINLLPNEELNNEEVPDFLSELNLATQLQIQGSENQVKANNPFFYSSDLPVEDSDCEFDIDAYVKPVRQDETEQAVALLDGC